MVTYNYPASSLLYYEDILEGGEVSISLPHIPALYLLEIAVQCRSVLGVFLPLCLVEQCAGRGVETGALPSGSRWPISHALPA